MSKKFVGLEKSGERDVIKRLLSYMIPGIMGLFFNSLYIVVDGLLVSRILGRNPLAAVTVAVPAMEVMIALSMLISVGSGVIISNKKGRDDLKGARETFNISVRLLLILSFVIMGACILFLKPIVGFLGATDELVEMTTEYLKYLFLFAPTFMFSYGLSAWVRNDGNPKIAMLAQIIGAITNIFLDWLFMAKFNMGVAGASIATGIGPVVGILIVLPHFIGKKGSLYFEKSKILIGEVSDILVKGIPSFTMQFALGMTTFCMNIMIAKYMGSIGLAAYGIIGYIALLVYSIFLGMAEGSQPLISYYQGSGESEKQAVILKYSIILSIMAGLVGYLLLNYFGSGIVRVFTGEDLELIAYTKGILKFYFIGLSITGVNIVVSSYMQSIGNWKISIVISMLRSFIILYPVLLVLPSLFGRESLWFGVPITEVLTLVVVSIFYLFNFRNKATYK